MNQHKEEQYIIEMFYLALSLKIPDLQKMRISVTCVYISTLQLNIFNKNINSSVAVSQIKCNSIDKPALTDKVPDLIKQ